MFQRIQCWSSFVACGSFYFTPGSGIPGYQFKLVELYNIEVDPNLFGAPVLIYLNNRFVFRREEGKNNGFFPGELDDSSIHIQ